MVTIFSRPSVNIPSAPTPLVSRYVCAFNPIVYTFNFSDIPDATYYLRVRVFEYGSNTLLADLSVRPIRVGDMRVDVSRYVRSYLESSYTPNFTGRINDAELKSVLRFYITYQENFIDGTTGSLISDGANYINAALSAKQIGQQYGQNMRDYTPLLRDGLVAKFLTEFETPVKWNGWPFTLSFIYSEDIIGQEVKRIETNLNINKAFISDGETQLDRSKANKINWVKISDNISENIKYINAKLRTGVAVGEMYVYDGYVEDGYVEVR